LDTKGPEIRSGKLAHDESGHETMTLQAGSSILLGTDAALQQAGSTLTNLFVDYPSLATAVTVGGKVLLDDGAIVLTVTSIVDGTTVECFIDNTGDLRSRAGVNLPLADTSDLPALSDKDKQDIAYGLTKDIDYVAASFVQTAAGVREIRAYIEQAAAAQNWPADKPLPLIISKIESASALSHFDEILAESDGIMVARGDLGVEIPLTQVCNAQKEMVHACNAAGKPVRGDNARGRGMLQLLVRISHSSYGLTGHCGDTNVGIHGQESSPDAGRGS
jgi:pyruvate kinase